MTQIYKTGETVGYALAKFLIGHMMRSMRSWRLPNDQA